MRLIQKAQPPANSEIRLTPEKEEGNIQKTEDSKKNKTKKDIYFAGENVNDPDFGQNGFLCADQFKSGDCLPLLNDNIEENFNLPALEFCDYEDRIKNDDSDIKRNLDANNDILSKLEEGRDLDFMLFQYPQHNNILTQQNNLQQIQDREQLRNTERKRKKLKDKGQIIKPQDQPGYVGNKDIDVIMKTMGFEEQQPSQQQQNQKSSQKANSPGNGGINNINSIILSSINNNNSLTKKQIKKQKHQKEEKPKWTSSKLEEKRRLWKKEIEETPLIKRIPKNILTSLDWTNPITIKSPFINQKEKINFEQVNLIWKQKPAPEYLLEKTTFIEYQKFIDKNNNNISKSKGGNKGGGHYRHR